MQPIKMESITDYKQSKLFISSKKKKKKSYKVQKLVIQCHWKFWIYFKKLTKLMQ